MSHSTDWLMRTTEAESIRALGRAVDRSHSTILRWARHRAPIDVIIRVAVDHGIDPVAALVECGWLTQAEREAITRNVPTSTLTAELHRRARAREL